MKTNRRGIPFLMDFYCFTMQWNPDDTTHAGRARLILSHTRKVLLKEVSWCIVGELYYHPTASLFLPPKPKKEIKCKCSLCRDGRRHCSRRHAEAARKMRGLFAKAERLFLEPVWMPLYGGKRWAMIADRARQLEEHVDFTVSGMRNLMVKIDMLIDSVHNCGPCLDKLHLGIGDFLTRKTHTNMAAEIYSGAQPFCRMIG